MNAEQNELITRVGPGTPCGALLRSYWQPAALVDEFNPALDPRMDKRPVKAVRLMGQDFVLFRDDQGHYGLLDRDCPHRGADLSFGRAEGDGLRCPFHGWKFDVSGHCLETPAEPAGSKLCDRVKQRSYPVLEKSGVIFAWLGPEGSTPPPLPAFDCFSAPATHSFAFKGLWNANWLQAFEVGIDPAHPSFLHRFLQDEALEDIGDNAAGKQFRSASAGAIAGEQWPMTRIMREFAQPEISVDTTPWGMQLTTLRPMNEKLTHVRVTHAIFPATFVIPLSETMTITQMHVPVDDTQTYLGMGEEDINVHDQWAVESMGAIQDRTREHLGTSDKVIMANRRALLKAIATVQQGGVAPGIADASQAGLMRGPDTVDGIAPAGEWSTWWQEQASAKQANAPWASSVRAEPVEAAE